VLALSGWTSTAVGQCSVQQRQKLVAADAARFDDFGRVSVSGSLAVVGAFGDDDQT
jgi:hypothetical protein